MPTGPIHRRTWQTSAVTTIKTSSAEAFLVVDLPEAPDALGTLRCAKKILQDGAKNLARVTTYSAAAYGLKISGASGGINAEGDQVAEAVAGAVAELSAQPSLPRLHLSAGKGLSPTDVASLAGLHPLDNEAALTSGLLGALDSLCALLESTGSTSPITIGLERQLGGPGSCSSDAIQATCSDRDVTIAVGALAELIEEPTDILILGSKPSLVDHQLAASLNTRAVLASGPLALTTKALATLTTAGCVIVPDFLSLGGPLLGFAAERDGQPVDLNAIRATTAAAVSSALPHPGGCFLGAARAAEEFMATWVTSMPFGRPLP